MTHTPGAAPRYRDAPPPRQPETDIALFRWLLLIPTAVLVGAALIALLGTVAQAMSSGRSASPTVWLREAFSRVLVLALTPLAFLDVSPAPITDAPTDGTHLPVVLIPGYATNRSAWWFLCQYLGHRGWRWLWPINHAGRGATIEAHAHRVKREVERICRASGAEKVDLVGFSMGGLAAAWYLHHLDGTARVRRLVTVATPWAGTRLATFALSPAGRQMRPDSEALEGLAPAGVHTVAIWSPDDPVVIPARSCVPPGAREVLVDGAGHLEMLFSARVFRAVQTALTHGEPDAPA